MEAQCGRRMTRNWMWHVLRDVFKAEIENRKKGTVAIAVDTKSGGACPSSTIQEKLLCVREKNGEDTCRKSVGKHEIDICKRE